MRLNIGDGAALTKQPGDEFKLSEVVAAVGDGVIDGVAREVEAGDAEAVLVDGVVIERVGLTVRGSDGGYTDNGKVGGERRKVAEVQGEVTRGDDDFLAVGKSEV